MTRKFIIIFFILTLYGCGFNPIYNVSNDIKYKILVNEMTGDQFINNIIRDEIFKSSNKNSKEILKINFNTVYEKIILSNGFINLVKDDFSIEIIQLIFPQLKNIRLFKKHGITREIYKRSGRKYFKIRNDT